MTTKLPRQDTIRELNDTLRQTFTGGEVWLSRQVAGLPLTDGAAVLDAVRRFDDFAVDDDPDGEHDCGTFSLGPHRVVWKITYFDPSMTRPSSDPADPMRTRRVMTIMLAEEL